MSLQAQVVGPHSRPITSMLFWSWYLVRYFGGAHRFQKFKNSIEEKIDADSHGQLYENYQAIPSVPIGEMSKERFQTEFLLKNTPVVIRGMAKNWLCVKSWDLNFFRQNYGKQEVPVRKKLHSQEEGWSLLENTPISHLIDNIQQKGDFMASFIVDIFNRNPELRHDIDLNYLNSFVCKNPRLPIRSTQLFISGSAGRTAFHCAPGANLFVQVMGKKQWTFVAPEYTKWMYPHVRENLFYGSSPVCHHMGNTDEYPLFLRVPKLRVVLEPGDVLFSPQWWWHAVDNLTDSIGVACRTFTKLYYGNLPFALLNIISLDVLNNYYRILRTGWNSDETIVKKFFKDQLRG